MPRRICLALLIAITLHAAVHCSARRLSSVESQSSALVSGAMARKLMQHVQSGARRLHQGFLGSDEDIGDSFEDDEIAAGDRRRLHQFDAAAVIDDDDEDEISDDDLSAGRRRLQQTGLATDVEDQYDEQDDGVDSYDSLGSGSDADSRFGFVNPTLPDVDESESVDGRRRVARAS